MWNFASVIMLKTYLQRSSTDAVLEMLPISKGEVEAPRRSVSGTVGFRANRLRVKSS